MTTMTNSNHKIYHKTRFPDAEKTISLAILGMIPGNGHPYSWSAIINGYDPEKMTRCPYAGIAEYMNAQPNENVGISKAQVTHIWTDDPEDAPKVADISGIQNVVAKPEDVIGQVDAVIIATDDGDNHIKRAAPFIEAGLPIFVDKPMATNIEDLRRFISWEREGNFILSSSGMRYAPEAINLRSSLKELGDLRWLSSTSIKLWNTYGIHALEGIFPLVGAGFESIRLEKGQHSVIAHLNHRSGAQVTLPVLKDGFGSFGLIQACGTGGSRQIRLTDTYTAFRGQLVAFVEALRRQAPPFPFTETIELMAVIIAGRRSLKEDSRLIPIKEILNELTIE